MKYIRIWCEYDIDGEFGGNNNEDVYSVPDSITKEEINQKIEERFSHIFEDIKEDDDVSFLDTGLIGWDYINITQL